jgi:hypothetical protein
VEQDTAILLQPNGSTVVVGKGGAYLVEPSKSLTGPEAGKPLTAGPFRVQKIGAGERFDLFRAGELGDCYQLDVEAGAIRSSRADGTVY